MVINKKVPYSGKGFIIKTSKGPKALYDYLWSLTEDIEFDKDPNANDEMRQNVQHFIAHIYHSIKAKLSKRDGEKEGNDSRRSGLYISIYSRLIQKEFGDDFKVLVLRNKGLIKMIGANSFKHRTRYYSLPRTIWETASEIENRAISEAWQALSDGNDPEYIPFNIVTGKRIKTVETNIYQPQEQSFKTPDLVKNAMKAISPCVFNPKYVGWWVDYLEKAYGDQKKVTQELIHSGNLCKDEIEEVENNLERLEKKYNNERRSQSTILYQQPVLIQAASEAGDLLYEYVAAYSPQVSGRLTELGGGLQNASRVFKSLAFCDVKNFYNYDLKASQANILIQELERCGVDASWITDYINDPNAKTTYAKLIGTNTETWKTCLYATFMGAESNRSSSTIQTTLIDYFDNEKSAMAAVKKFSEIIKGLFLATKRWRSKIISLSESPYIYDSRKGGYRFWKNACDMRFKKYGINRKDKIELMEVTKYSKEKGNAIAKSRRKLAAFILQGQEACFIHHLTILCNDNGIKVMRNEHDGIITDNMIPEKIIRIAGTRAKLKGAELDRKPLAGKDDIDKASKLIGRRIPYI